MPDRRRFRTINQTRGRRMDMPFMKLPIAEPSESIMQFFTPELYLRFNSENDDVASAADGEWERAIGDYRQHLDTIRDQMPSQVRKLAALDLHDAEFLACDELVEPTNFGSSKTLAPLPHWSALQIVSVKQSDALTSLIYFLWDRVREAPSPSDWPFSKNRPHWLYDEIGTAANRAGSFLHRILCSDGRVVEIPFTSVVIHPFKLTPAGDGKI
jgi:hypothetical protein